ncbi:MAG: pilus assembly protein [Candidatus Eremiobacteraeota bacterium]|nr:pilus assembly protein [Candidatus Eremiobacteraeota bacterium]
MRLIDLRRLARADGGTAVAEMAVIAPLVILLLVGLIEVGRWAHYSVLVGNAARAGVQYGAQNLATAADSSGMQAAALNDAQNVAGLSATATSFCRCSDGTASTCQPSDCASSHRLVFVQVDTTGTFRSLLHLAIVSDTQTITSRAIMRVAQ